MGEESFDEHAYEHPLPGSAGSWGPEAASEALESIGRDAWRIFDEVATFGRSAQVEVVARPGEPLREPLVGGEILIQRALGEGRLAFASVIASPYLRRHEELYELGIEPSRASPGTYAEVAEERSPRPSPGGGATRLLDDRGRLPHDRVLVRRASPGPYVESVGAGETTLPLAHFQQWMTNSIVSDAARFAAPMGPAWVRKRLASGTASTIVGAVATELQQLEAQRPTPRVLATNYRIDTAQTDAIRRGVAHALAQLEVLDTAVATDVSTPRVFATLSEIAARKDHWRREIDKLAASSFDTVLGWIVGKEDLSRNPTIKAAAKEASDQISHFREAGKKAASSSMADPVEKSLVRDFDRQLCIWVWKYFFLDSRKGLTVCSSKGDTGNFGWMTTHAAAKCAAAMPAHKRAFKAATEWQPRSHADTAAHRTGWTTHLSSDERQQEILQTSSAPGISRHHWGTDTDIGSVEGPDWKDAKFVELYAWLVGNGLPFGMTQVYTNDRPGYASTSSVDGYGGYIEELWHWSYYPVAQALLEWAAVSSHRAKLFDRLKAEWGKVRTDSSYRALRRAIPAWTSTVDPFTYIQAHWDDYVFNVNRYVTSPVP